MNAEHNSIDNKNGHRCPRCSRQFDYKSQLKDHVERDHIEKPYDENERSKQPVSYKEFICEKCGQMFAHKGNFESHLRTYASDKDQKSEKCYLCNKLFTTKASVKRHLEETCIPWYKQLKAIEKKHRSTPRSTGKQ